MESIISKCNLKDYIKCQMENLFPDKNTSRYFQGNDVDMAIDRAFERMEYCFKYITNTAYSDDKGQTYFNYLHSDQYAAFIYWFSNSLWKISQNKLICDKALLLNKTLNTLFLSYKCHMPDIFYLAHPFGTIIGNADYSDFLVVSHGVTINTGEPINGRQTPKLGKGLFLAAGAKIIGEETIGDRVTVGVDAVVFRKEIENDKLVIRDDNGKIIIMENKKLIQQKFFRVPIE